MSRKLALALLPVAACVGFAPAQAAPSVKTVTATGTVQSVCKIGTSTSYAVSISSVGTGAMTTTASLDGTAGNAQNQNNQNTVVTKNYATICNRTTSQTLTMSAPAATKSGGGTLAYTIQVFNAANGGGAQVASISTEPGTQSVVIPALTSANWSIRVTAVNRNNTPAGTYTATVTIQSGP